jgi:tellurite resistance protein TehA-like permease
MPGWFAIVMGLCGLSLAWHRAVPLMGEMAGAGALVVGALAALVAAVLAVLSLLRWQRYPKALAEDLNHPVRHVVCCRHADLTAPAGHGRHPVDRPVACRPRCCGRWARSGSSV